MASMIERVVRCSFLTAGRVYCKRKGAFSGVMGVMVVYLSRRSLHTGAWMRAHEKWVDDRFGGRNELDSVILRTWGSGILRPYGESPAELEEAGADAVGEACQIDERQEVNGLEFAVDGRRATDAAGNL